MIQRDGKVAAEFLLDRIKGGNLVVAEIKKATNGLTGCQGVMLCPVCRVGQLHYEIAEGKPEGKAKCYTPKCINLVHFVLD